jgi:hypothetical protein
MMAYQIHSTMINTKGYLYVIKCGEFYKIGRTRNFPSRMEYYRTANPHKVEIVKKKLLQDCYLCERELLLLMSPKQYQREWHQLDTNDLAKIDRFFRLSR